MQLPLLYPVLFYLPCTIFLAAPSAPLNLTFPPVGVLNDSVTLTWLSPLHPNGVIQLYELRWSSSGVDVFENTTDDISTAVLSDLVPGTQYTFSVRGFTVAFGPFSDQLSLHTADGESILICDIIEKFHISICDDMYEMTCMRLGDGQKLVVPNCFYPSSLSALSTSRCQCPQDWFYHCVGDLDGACCVLS